MFEKKKVEATIFICETKGGESQRVNLIYMLVYSFYAQKLSGS